MRDERTVTLEDYRRAETYLSWNVQKRAFLKAVAPNWIDGTDRFWYCVQTPAGTEFVLDAGLLTR